MKVLKLNLVLATAAAMAALAATSCGSGSLNMGSETDVDLASSTSVPAEAPKTNAYAQFDLDGPGQEPLEGFGDIEDPWAWDLKHIDVEYGKNVIENDEYLDSRNAHEYEAANGHAQNMEGDWVPIMDSFTGLYDLSDMSFAVYGFKGLIENQKVVGHVELHGDKTEYVQGTGFYIGLANFDTGRWEFKGPFTNLDHVYQIGIDGSVSPEGYSYVSLVVDRNVGLELDEIDVWIGNPNV